MALLFLLDFFFLGWLRRDDFKFFIWGLLSTIAVIMVAILRLVVNLLLKVYHRRSFLFNLQ